MLSPRKSVSRSRAIAYCLAVLAALTMLKFGFFTPAMGVFFGVWLSLQWVVETEGEDAPMGVALLVIALGVLLWALGGLAAFLHDIELADPDQGRRQGRFIRSLPFLAVLCVVAGSFLALANLLGRRGKGDSAA